MRTRVQLVSDLNGCFSRSVFVSVFILLGFQAGLSSVYPFIYKLFVDKVLFAGNIRALRMVLELMAVWMFVNAAVKSGLSRKRSEFLVKASYEVRMSLFRHMTAENMHDSQRKTASELKYTMEDDCNEIEKFFLKDVFEYALSMLDVCILAVVMAVISLPLLVGCMAFFLLSYFETKLIKKKVRDNAAALRRIISQTDHICTDEFKSIKEIKCLNYEDIIVKAFHERSRQAVRLITKERIYQYVNKYLSAMNHDLITRFFLYLLGGNMVIGSHLDISSFLVFMGFYETFVKEVRKLMDSNFSLNSRIDKLQNVVACLKSDVYAGAGTEERIEHICFSDVTFRYPGTRKGTEILQKFCREFHRGETYLLQGKSGSGKSTMIKLLYKEYGQYEGKILINGKELSLWQNDAYYSKIAVASCDSRLFHSSIRENLLLADPLSTEEELYQACANAEFEVDLQKMPNGLDTLVGENGMTLSGGQRQRLILSRLFLKQADLYLLDEALDEIGIDDEKRILDRLRKMHRDSIMIVVSHRLVGKKIS